MFNLIQSKVGVLGAVVNEKVHNVDTMAHVKSVLWMTRLPKSANSDKPEKTKDNYTEIPPKSQSEEPSTMTVEEASKIYKDVEKEMNQATKNQSKGFDVADEQVEEMKGFTVSPEFIEPVYYGPEIIQPKEEKSIKAESKISNSNSPKVNQQSPRNNTRRKPQSQNSKKTKSQVDKFNERQAKADDFKLRTKNPDEDNNIFM